MAAIGYTPAQADRVKFRIDRWMAKTEDAAYAMRHEVKDISVATASVEILLEQLREIAEELKAIVDRRTNA